MQKKKWIECNQKLEKLSGELEVLRSTMHNLVKTKGSFVHPEVLEISCRIDRKVNNLFHLGNAILAVGGLFDVVSIKDAGITQRTVSDFDVEHM